MTYDRISSQGGVHFTAACVVGVGIRTQDKCLASQTALFKLWR